MKAQKAWAIETASTRYETNCGQWWEKTESGKSWRLWGYVDGLVHMIKSIPAHRVLWVFPTEPKESTNA